MEDHRQATHEVLVTAGAQRTGSQCLLLAALRDPADQSRPVLQQVLVRAEAVYSSVSVVAHRGGWAQLICDGLAVSIHPTDSQPYELPL